MSENDNTQTTEQPSADQNSSQTNVAVDQANTEAPLQTTDSAPVWTDASEQMLQDLSNMYWSTIRSIYPIEEIKYSMENFVFATDNNPFIVNDIILQTSELLKFLPDLTTTFFAELFIARQKYDELTKLPLAADHVDTDWWNMWFDRVTTQHNDCISAIQASKEILESRKLDDETNAALLNLIDLGTPLFEMYSGTLAIIDSMSLAYNQLFRNGYFPILKDYDAAEGELRIAGFDESAVMPPTKEQIIVTVDLINTFLSSVYDTLEQRASLYTMFEEAVKSLSENVKNYYFTNGLIQEVEMFNILIPVYEGVIEQLQKVINEGIPTPGPKGDTGHVGDTGSKGDKGSKGDTGPSGTLTLDYLKLGLIFGAGSVIGAIISAMMCFFCI